MKLHQKFLGSALCAALCSQVSASCPRIQQELCSVLGCICVPEALPKASVEAAALVLEQWLYASRNGSLPDSKPIPPAIRNKLDAYIDTAVLDAARYKIDDQGLLNLAGINLRYGYLVGNQVAAVTLIDVIVFRDSKTVDNDAMWAHELFHVQQFRQWGTRSFAHRYAQDYQMVEGPAYAFQEQYLSQRAQYTQ